VRPARVGVVLVAHGSRDRRAAEATRALAWAVGAARPDLDIRAAFLDHSEPRPVNVLGDLERAGHRRAVMVPLLLTAAYHGRVDVPAEVAAARAAGLRLDVDISDVLGPSDGRVDPLLIKALVRRLHADCAVGGGPRFDAVVLAAAGTRNGRARGGVGRVAAALSDHLGLSVRVAYASAAPPAAGVAVARLRAAGARRVGVAAYFLAPGLLYDAAAVAARAAGAVGVAAPLGAVPELVRLVSSRVDAVAGSRAVARAL
jgi:sirohydrochlorin ferrochelatase